MNKLTRTKRAQVIAALVEGSSIRSTVRMTGVSMMTVLKLLREIGEVCRRYQDEQFRNLTCKRIQVDEIWSFCRAKARNVPEDHKNEFGWGDVWTWVAIDADTKLVPSWLIGNRGLVCATEFIADLKGRLAHRVQLTSDGYHQYLRAVESAFGSDIDYAILMKSMVQPLNSIGIVLRSALGFAQTWCAVTLIRRISRPAISNDRT
jgi:transposase